MASRKAKTSAMMEDEEFISFDLFRTNDIHNRRSNGISSRQAPSCNIWAFRGGCCREFAIDLSKLREGKHIAPWLIEPHAPDGKEIQR